MFESGRGHSTPPPSTKGMTMNRPDDATLNILGQMVAGEFLDLGVPQEWFIETLPSSMPVLELSEHSSNCALCLAQQPCRKSDDLELNARWVFADQLIESLRN